MLKSNYEFEVLVHGSSAKEYYHKGNIYIEGKEGSRFSLRMRNNSNHRVLFVPTVDGLSIMNGKEASFKSRGYIVSARDSLTIDGWRTSDDKVAEFFFSSPKNSYAKKINKGGNLGVVGCAVFKEKKTLTFTATHIVEHIPYPVYPTPWKPYPGSTWPNNDGIKYYSSNVNSENTMLCASSVSGNNSIQANVQGLGTGFGQDKYSPVIKVEFDKESSPAEVFSIYYNTRKKLEELGIEFRKPIYVEPSAFPNEDGYCKRPY